jgi:hypothetical protein
MASPPNSTPSRRFFGHQKKTGYSDEINRYIEKTQKGRRMQMLIKANKM